MGIFDALTTAVAGLQAQSFALQNISGNIANSQTTGYKETDTSFEDLVSAAGATADHRAAWSPIRSPPTPCRARSRARRSRPTWRSTATAISWWRSRPALADNQPQFSGVNYYTRAGDFQLNQNGYLVNGAGYYLMGVPINPSTGNPVGSVPQVLQFNNDFVPAQADHRSTTRRTCRVIRPRACWTRPILRPIRSPARRCGRHHRHRRNAFAGRAGAGTGTRHD